MQDESIPLGLCQCGCGARTSLAPQSHTHLGHVKGQPVRFLPGHANRRTPHSYEVRECGYQTPCWIWVRFCDKRGYGRSTSKDGTRPVLAHVALWTERHGLVPEGLELDHLCQNPPCVNPDHLEAVTHTENMRRGRNAKLTAESARSIRASAEPYEVLAERYAVSRCTIHDVRVERTWKGV